MELVSYKSYNKSYKKTNRNNSRDTISYLLSILNPIELILETIYLIIEVKKTIGIHQLIMRYTSNVAFKE